MKKRTLMNITYPGRNVIDFDKAALNVGISIQKTVDDAILEALYRIYKKSDVATLYIIDEEQFERFLRKYLPMWKKDE